MTQFSEQDVAKAFDVDMLNFSASMDDLQADLMQMRNEGLKKGAWLGFAGLDELWTMKRGSTTYLVAPPHVGKSSFINEIVDNLICFSGWKVVIFSPETGCAKDVYNELLWTHLKIPFIKNKKNINASDADVADAFRVLRNNVRVLDFGIKDVTIDMIYQQVLRLKEAEGFDADLLIIDPFTEIKSDVSRGAREDIAIGELLTKIRRYSSKYDLHTLVAVHTKTLEFSVAKDINGNAMRYQAQASMFDVAGGNMWSRKGMMIITLWRPPVGLPYGDDGQYYYGDETVVKIEKAKPKNAGSRGEFVLKYDRIANRYYETDSTGGNRRFSYKCPNGFSEREISPNYKGTDHLSPGTLSL